MLLAIMVLGYRAAVTKQQAASGCVETNHSNGTTYPDEIEVLAFFSDGSCRRHYYGPAHTLTPFGGVPTEEHAEQNQILSQRWYTKEIEYVGQGIAQGKLYLGHDLNYYPTTFMITADRKQLVITGERFGPDTYRQADKDDPPTNPVPIQSID